MKRIIVNGDDYGYTQEKSEGILKAHREGILTSTTAMVNVMTPEAVGAIAPFKQSLGIGVHLNITFGPPVTPADKVPSLVSREGVMVRPQAWTHTAWDEFGNGLNLAEVELEYRNQIKCFEEMFGMPPTHLDSHHFMASHKQIFPVMLKLAREFGLPVRLPGWIAGDDRFETEASLEPAARRETRTTDYGCWEFFNNGPAPLDRFMQTLKNMKDGTTEFMFHPSTSQSNDRRGRQGKIDLELLTHSDVKHLVKTENIQLITYRNL